MQYYLLYLRIYADLPGFTRSIYRRNYALITPESHVFAGNPLWYVHVHVFHIGTYIYNPFTVYPCVYVHACRKNALTAHLISPTVGANFAMYLVTMKSNSTGVPPAPGIERFMFILDGVVQASINKKGAVSLHADQYAYLPPNTKYTVTSEHGAGLLIYERKYAIERAGAAPIFQHGTVSEHPVLPVDGEVFVLRKLLPQTEDYDFNIHVMDFLPGEYLNVKEVHYNQHGLLLLAGKGVYRLGDEWMPITKGDAVWMAPYCPQWYAALGPDPSRYILYKDTTVDPLEG